MTDTSIHPSKEKKLYDYLKENYPEISRFQYDITEHDDNFIFQGIFKDKFTAEKQADCIPQIEEILDATFISINQTPNVLTFIFKLNWGNIWQIND